MPGRLLDVFSRNRAGVSRSESFKSQHSDGSSTGKPKKVSFDRKLKIKRFKPGKKKKPPPRATAAVAPLPANKRDGSSVVAYVQSTPPSGAAKTGEFWFTPHQRTADTPMRGKPGDAPPPKMAYNYELDPSLHPSQQPSQVPRVQRHLVRSIVAQFNEEAKKRGTSRQTSLDDEEPTRRPATTSPVLIEATPDNAPNRREPFSYTAGAPAPAPPTLGPRSKSDYNIQVPGDLIYAQVVVNGQKTDGKHKTTIHTKVPRSVDAKKNFSKSTGNLLHAAEADDAIANSYQLRNGKKTDNSYYKFDAVDEELARTSMQSKAQRNGRHQPRSSSLGVESEGDEAPFEAPSRHHLIRLPDANGLLKKSGDYETRNVEKWSENEVGPNSKKYTEHEYVHEVSRSQGGEPAAALRNKNLLAGKTSPIYGTPLKLQAAITTRENVQDKSKEWHYGTDNSLLREQRKSRHQSEKGRRAPSPDYRPLKASSKENVAAKPAAQYYFGERSPRDSPLLLERVLEASEQKNGWKTITGDDHRRRNSSDSGSGVGLLSSKLVKKADAEVNGYAEDDPFDSGDELENRRYRRAEDKFQNGDHRFGSNDKMASPTWLTTRNSDDNLTFYNNGFGDTAIPAGGYTSEQRRVFRKEEKKHVTKRETRTTRPSPSPERDDNSSERHRALRYSRERSTSGSPAPSPRTPTSGGHRTPTSGHRQEDDEAFWASRVKTPSPVGKQQQEVDEAFWASRVKTPSPVGKQQQESRRKTTERKVDIEIGEQHSRRRHQSHQGGAFGDDYEDKMETSESEPQLYGGSQDSHMSLGSRLSSAEEEERRAAADEVIAAHVNTPQSLLKQMNKRQISYENAQHRQEGRQTESTGRQLWFERRGVDEVDRADANSNHYLASHHHNNNNNNQNQRWTSATMSRLETNKNRRNDEHQLTVNTVDRRRRKGDDIRIQLNDRDMPRDAALANGKAVGRSSSFNSRVGSYHSGDESQHSTGSTASKKRVNFKKTNGRSKGFGSRSDLSPMHREALLRSTSPARPPSATGSLKSNESDASHASNRSVILHATAVADIPPARGYRYRSANTSPSPPSIASSGGGRESRSVQRSFSLLSPWKPRKYKDKYDKKENPKFAGHEFEVGRRRSYHEEQQLQLSKQQQQQKEGGNRSHNSSSERLDSLAPLASESPPTTKAKGKKKSSSILRRHSMPKDSRFANFFRRKK